ncbi:hypothetical protein AM493_18690 [Flavobacterium akiainvivens]|uniref:Phytase-like domain-containing protein n=1 Tax=Flavobacterium akiainvivens TaxID=1202724 RepID=A0A0M8ML95_9FLAO|nr:hypothetical protein [Flavobacterium akiainvivens]KOS07858.1 hypothetical protein AM493_18690 [Flavobacterium akiainvivens]SFQ27642.1 hypothetical protein SAMN05444144_102319 [Flavobacterium akiainvivens]
MKYLIALLAVITACSATKENKLKEIASLPLKEVSGLEYINGKLYAIEDSGNKNKLYRLGLDGSIEKSYTQEFKNIDWEDLASDAQGNICIGDFGNNENDRKDLAIYKVAANKPDSLLYKIEFKYPDQTEFPPKKAGLLFDVEAFFEYKGNFYLFTKNRSKGFDGTITLYKVPDAPGSHTATKLGTMNTCDNYKRCAIAGADISPDGTKAVLISGENVWLLTDFANGDFAKATVKQLNLGHLTQKEGICFKDSNTLLIADEKDNGTGGKLYEVKLSDL